MKLFFSMTAFIMSVTLATEPFDMMSNCQLVHSVENCRVDLAAMCGEPMKAATTVLDLTRVYNNECHRKIALSGYNAYDHVQFNNPKEHIYEWVLYVKHIPNFQKTVRAEKAGPAIVQSGKDGVGAQILHRIHNPVFDRFEWSSKTAFAG